MSILPVRRESCVGTATTLGVVMLCASLLLTARALGRPPNVILLMPDQMRGQAMGVAGNDQVQTPHIDQIAREGIYLPNTFANSPVCCPARATILTGLYSNRHGVIVNDLRLHEDRVTLAEVLADAGYATGFVGKWHLDGGERMPGFVPPGPRRQGFAFWAANQCNHRHFDSVYFRDSADPIPIKRFEVEVWVDEAVRFIRANRERPFFLMWACGPPHNPYRAPPEFEKMYDPAELTMRPNWEPGSRWGSRKDVARYYAMITAMDKEIGRLMQELATLDLVDDTIVVFTSDHGDMLGSHGTEFKCKPYAESINVPGIIRYPRRIQAGRRAQMLMSHVDLMPTLLALCGVKPPGGLQGRDLSRRLLTAGPEGDEIEDYAQAVYLQIFEPRPRHQVPGGWRGIRTSRYTYARLKDRPWVLFDHEKDPYESRNRVDDPSYAEVSARLDRVLEARMNQAGDTWELDLEESRPFHRGPAVYGPAVPKP